MDPIMPALSGHSAQAAMLAPEEPAMHIRLPALTLLLADPSGWVRGAAADALALIGEPAVPALGEALQDPREGVRVRAAYALRRIKSAKSARWLFPALNDPNHIVHTYAYEALDEMGMLDTVLVM
jgi:HEAT repeat protein